MEKLKERKNSLFLLTGITPDILKNEPLVHLNLEDSFFLKEMWTRKIIEKRRGGRSGMVK